MSVPGQPPPEEAPGVDSRRVPLVDLGFFLAALLFAFRTMLQAAPYADPVSGIGDAPEFFEPGSSSPMLILVCAAWIVWNRRWALFGGATGARGAGATILLASAAILLWGQFIGAYDLSALALSLALLGMGAVLGGGVGLRAMVFPAAFVLLAFPLPGVLMNQVLLPLQLSTQKLSLFYLDLIGIEARGQFDLIFSGGRIFQVIESCAGYRAMETLTMSAFLYSELFQLRTWIRIVIILAAAPVAFLLNGVRVVTIVLLPVETSHTLQGLVAIAVGVLVLAQLARLLQWFDKRPARQGPAHLVSSLPVGRVRALTVGWALVGLLGIAIPQWDSRSAERFSLRGFPMQVDGWGGSPGPIDSQFLGTARPTAYVIADYARDDQVIEAYVGVDRLLDRRLSILSEKTLFPGAGSTELARGETKNALGDPVTFSILRKAGGRNYWLVNRWYEGVDSIPLEILRSIAGLDRSPFRDRSGILVVRIATPLGGGNPFDEGQVASAQRRLDEFSKPLQEFVGTLRSRNP